MTIEEVVSEAKEHARAVPVGDKWAIYWGALWRTKTGRLRQFDTADKAKRLFINHLRSSHAKGLDSVIYDEDGTMMDMVWY